MYKQLLIFLFIVLANYSFAQENYDILSEPAQKKRLESAEKIKDVNERLKAFENIFDSNKVVMPKYLADLYCCRADAYWEKYLLDSLDITNYQSGSRTGSTIIKHILVDYQTAIKMYPLNEPNFRSDRMDFLNELNSDHPFVAQDLAYLKQHGYKEEFYGITPGINYMQGKNSWVGIDISFLGYVSPSYALKNKDTTDGKIKKINTRDLPAAFAFLTVGYNQSLKNSAHEFTISGMRITAPIYLEVAKFGFESGLNAPHPLWFYRPEIGIGNSFISVGYAYNLLFAKSQRSNWEKSLFVIKLCYPIIKYK